MFNYWDTHPIIEEFKLTVPPFVPTFRTVYGYAPDNNGGVYAYPLNPDYFASQATAQWIADKYSVDKKVYQAAFESIQPGQPFAIAEPIFVIKLSNGQTPNAGVMAAYYSRNPENKFPGLADRLIRNAYGIL